MRTIIIIVQIVAALGLLNVWLLRASKRTAYRGGGASSMREEFAAYGLPDWFMYLVGALKIAVAILLLVGIWVPSVVLPTALLLCILMLGALSMHVKIGDPIVKSLPAFGMLALGIVMALASKNW